MKSRIMVILLGMSLLTGSPVFASSSSDSGLKGFLKRCIEWVKTTFELDDSNETTASESSDSSALAASTEESSTTASTCQSGNAENQITGFLNRKSELLSKFDADGDGKLSKVEMANAVEARKQDMLAKYDADGDGVLSDSEKETMRKDAPRMRGRHGPPPDGTASGSAEFETKRAAFVEKYDADGDGSLSESEMAVAEAAREQEMLAKYDADEDGVLSDSEKEAMRKDAPQMRGRHGPPPDGTASGSAEFETKRAAFVEKYDADGDGSLSESEMTAAEAAREQEMLAKYDADDDGVLSDSEKATMMEDAPAMGRGRHGPPPPRRNASDSEDAGIMPEMDMTATSTNIDGVSPDQGVIVNRFQWRRGAGKRLSKEQSEARKKAMIDMFDENGDGILQESEQANAKSTFQGYYGEISEEADE